MKAKKQASVGKIEDLPSHRAGGTIRDCLNQTFQHAHRCINLDSDIGFSFAPTRQLGDFAGYGSTTVVQLLKHLGNRLVLLLIIGQCDHWRHGVFNNLLSESESGLARASVKRVNVRQQQDLQRSAPPTSVTACGIEGGRSDRSELPLVARLERRCVLFVSLHFSEKDWADLATSPCLHSENTIMADPAQFTSLFVKHERQLYGFIAAMLGQPAEAEDLLQETAKGLWKKFGDYDPALPFLPWAKTFARYEVLNYLERQRTRRKYFSDEMVELLADDWGRVDAQHDARILALESCVEALPEKSRCLLNERYQDANSLQDVATREGTTPNALYKSLQRIRKILLDCVNQKLAEGAV